MRRYCSVGIICLGVGLGLILGSGVRLMADGAVGFSLIIQQGGTPKGAAVTMNCSTNVTCTLSGGVVTVTAASGSSGYSTVENSGSALTQRATLNFSGSGVSCADNAPDTRTDCTVTGSSGGGGASFGTFAALPSETDGALYQQTDGPYSFIGASGIWNAFIPVFGAVTMPVSGTPAFAWANQGGATVTNVHGGEIMQVPSSSGDNLRVRYIAAPSTPYTITAIFNPQIFTNNYLSAGLVFYNSSTGNLATFGPTSASASGPAQNVIVQYWNSVTSINSNAGQNVPWSFGAFQGLRVLDDGTNWTFSVSSDGQNWQQFYKISRTAFMTPQSVGYFVDVNNATYTASYWLLSWVQGT